MLSFTFLRCHVMSTSSTSPRVPGTKPDFTPDRNEQKIASLSSYLGFVGLSLLLIPSNMYAQLKQYFFALSLLSHFITILYPSDMADPSNLKDACHIRF